MAEKPENQEEELFYQALNQDPADRSAYLKGRCGGNHELYHRMKALLRAYTSDDRSHHITLGNSQATLPDASHIEGSGTVIGRYKLLEKVGEGGFGVVYVAEQKRPVKRRVALKIIKLGMDTKQVVARFEAERQALALMDHPHIAKVLDAGATDLGRPYFVMELVRGIPINQYCDQEKLSMRVRLDLFIEVCRAIQHAHQKGIIHRDIKPSNILVTLHDGVPVPKVIDFGIAKATQQDLTEKTLYTQLQQFVGTPAYMSPEQAEMSGLDVDTRSDIYSLGVLLYELLTGCTPFDAKDLMQGGVDAMRKAIREQEPPKPSTKIATLEAEEQSITAARHSVEVPRLMSLLRGDMDWIIMKCLEKDRTRRYETANAIAMDIGRHQMNEPIAARPPSSLYRLQKMIRRNRLAVGAAVVVMIVLVLGVTVSSWQAIRATRAHGLANALLLNEQRLREEMQVARDTAVEQRAIAEAARIDADRKLYRSFIDQARLAQVLNEPGFRSTTESFLKQAAALETDVSNDLEMRNTALAVMLEPYSDDPEWMLSRPNFNRGIPLWSLARDEIAFIDQDGSIMLVEIASHDVVIIPGSGSSPVQNIAFGQDGDTLLSSHQDGAVRVWKRGPADNWSMARELPVAGEGTAIDVAMGTSGMVALVSETKRLYYWESPAASTPDIQILPEIYRQERGRRPVLDRKCHWLAIPMSASQGIVIWDVQEERVTKSLLSAMPHLESTLNMAFSPKGDYFVWGTPGLMQLFKTETFELLFEQRDGSTWNGQEISFNPDNTQVTYGSNPAYVHLLAANLPLVTMTGERTGLFFSKTTGALFQYYSHEAGFHTLERWSKVSSEFVELVGHEGAGKGITFHPTESLAVTTSTDKTVRFWNLDDGGEVQRIVTPEGGSEDAMFSPDGRFFVTALEDDRGTIQLRDARTTQIIQMFELGARPYAVDFSEKDAHLCISGVGLLKVWSYQSTAAFGEPADVTLTLVKAFQEPEMGSVTWVRFSPQGRYLAWFETGPNNPSGLGERSNGIRIWDLETDRELSHRIMAHSAWNTFDFMEGGSRMVVAGLEGGIEVWDFVKGEREARLKGWEKPCAQLDVSHDGRLLSFSTAPKNFGIFDLEKRQLLFVSPELSNTIWQMRWNQDSSRLGMVEGNGRARILDMTAIRSKLDALGLDW